MASTNKIQLLLCHIAASFKKIGFLEPLFSYQQARICFFFSTNFLNSLHYASIIQLRTCEVNKRCVRRQIVTVDMSHVFIFQEGHFSELFFSQCMIRIAHVHLILNSFAMF